MKQQHLSGDQREKKLKSFLKFVLLEVAHICLKISSWRRVIHGALIVLIVDVLLQDNWQSHTNLQLK